LITALDNKQMCAKGKKLIGSSVASTTQSERSATFETEAVLLLAIGAEAAIHIEAEALHRSLQSLRALPQRHLKYRRTLYGP
jgi:hypothetical protein